MRRTRPRAQVSEEVELRAKEYNRQEQRQKGYSRCAIVHVLTNAELRQEWLRGQALPATNRFRRSVYRNSQRIAPRNLLTPTGTMTFSTATASWSLRFTAINLTNKTAVISCLLSAARHPPGSGSGPVETARTKAGVDAGRPRLVSGRRKGAGGRRGCWELAMRRNSCHSP
jgi:hypothetical protein